MDGSFSDTRLSISPMETQAVDVSTGPDINDPVLAVYNIE
jgi:hypothetical protein